MTRSSRSSRSTLTGNEKELAEKIDGLRVSLSELVSLAPAIADEVFDHLKRHASELCENCEKTAGNVTKTLKEHPLQVLLVGAGAGLLTWWLLSRDEAGGGHNIK